MCACTRYLRKPCRCIATTKPTLPSPSGTLAESINPATIKAANEAVKDATLNLRKSTYYTYNIIYPLYIRACAVRVRVRARYDIALQCPTRNLKIRNFILKIFSTFSPPKITRYTVLLTIISVFIAT